MVGRPGIGLHPRNLEIIFPRWPDEVERAASYTIPPPIFRRRNGRFSRDVSCEILFLFDKRRACHWQTLAGFLRAKSATTLLYANSGDAAYAKPSKPDHQQNTGEPSLPKRTHFSYFSSRAFTNVWARTGITIKIYSELNVEIMYLSGHSKLVTQFSWLPVS